MFFRASLLSAAVLVSFPGAACEMHATKSNPQAAISTPRVDPVITASMVMAEPVVLADITIEGYWIKAMLPGQPVAGGFLKLTNKGATDDKLIAASSAKSGRIELHEMAMDGDVMKMREIEGGIAIPAGATVELAPGGLHVMFFEITEAFKDGDLVPVTLTFEKAGTVQLNLPVMAKAMSH